MTLKSTIFINSFYCNGLSMVIPNSLIVVCYLFCCIIDHPVRLAPVLIIVAAVASWVTLLTVPEKSLVEFTFVTESTSGFDTVTVFLLKEALHTNSFKNQCI